MHHVVRPVARVRLRPGVMRPLAVAHPRAALPNVVAARAVRGADLIALNFSKLSAAEYPSQVVEKEWRHWMQFFNGSNARLAPHGRCDCHRSYARPVGSKTIENRFLVNALKKNE